MPSYLFIIKLLKNTACRFSRPDIFNIMFDENLRNVSQVEEAISPLHTNITFDRYSNAETVSDLLVQHYKHVLEPCD